MNETPIAVDIYERQEMTANGEAGSVYDDLYAGNRMLTLDDFEDYFGDEDPFKFL
jgi:hypothetical protein